MSAAKPNIPERVLRVVRTVSGGQKLCKSLRIKETGETEVSFHFEPCGRAAPPKSSQNAIELGLVQPAGDSLFGEEMSQTFTAKAEAAE